MFVSITKFKETVRYFEKIKGILREGCKQKIARFFGTNIDESYLNYEGCKLNFSVSLSACLTASYLNYEGCKHWQNNLKNIIKIIVLSEL